MTDRINQVLTRGQTSEERIANSLWNGGRPIVPVRIIDPQPKFSPLELALVALPDAEIKDLRARLRARGLSSIRED